MEGGTSGGCDGLALLRCNSVRDGWWGLDCCWWLSLLGKMLGDEGKEVSAIWYL